MFDAIVNDRFARGIIRRKVRQLIDRAGFPRQDAEDLEQELLLHLLKSFLRFRDSHACHRNAFITAVVERAAALLIRRRNAKKRSSDNVQSLERLAAAGDGAADCDPSCVNAPNTAEARELAHDVKQVIDRLPPDLADLAERLKHQSLAAIARELDVPASTLQRRRDRLRQFFRRAGLRNF